MTEFPSAEGLRSLIKPLAKGRGQIIELRSSRGEKLGNNGDRLLDLAFEGLVSEFGLRLTTDPGVAVEYLVVPPNGALVETYRFPQLLTRRLAEMPDKPLIIFPSSALFPTSDPAKMFGRRSAPTLWILREKHSFDHLNERWGDSLQARNVTLALDHDVVVSGGHHVLPIFGSQGAGESGSGLVVARLGVEAGDMRTNLASPTVGPARRAAVGLAVNVFRHMPQDMKVSVRRQRTRSRQEHANQELISRLPLNLLQELEKIDQAGRVGVDISDPTLSSFQNFVERISSASFIATNRLHAAIPGALLGKRVLLVDAGYHKLAGVFEQSLQNVQNVTFLPRDE